MTGTWRNQLINSVDCKLFHGTSLRRSENRLPSWMLSNSPIFIQTTEHTNDSLMQVLNNISMDYSLPIIDTQDIDSIGHEVMSTYTHCLSALPYQFSSISTFSLGIQPYSYVINKMKKKKNVNAISSFNPVVIDFLPSSDSDLGKRLSLQSGGEILLKAAGVGKYTDAVIYDLTAGFGQDSLIFASSNNVKKVYMMERDPIVGLLLSDAIRRLQLISTMPEVDLNGTDLQVRNRAKTLCEKFILNNIDSIDIASLVMISVNDKNKGESSCIAASQPDICYLDPMFPPRQKSAAVKKNMQILHGLFQSNQMLDEELRLAEEVALLQTAMSLAKSRVVVKRPIHSPPIGSLRGRIKSSCLPSYELKGTINRFDVYIL